MRRMVFALLIVAATALAAAGQGNGGYDSSADGTQAMLLRSDDIGGPTYGLYTTITGTSPITSQIASGGNFGLVQTTAPQRTVWVPATTFSQGPYWTGVWIYNYCQDQFGNKVQMVDITTASANCGLAINFNPYGNTNPQGTSTQPTYKLIMGPNLLNHLQTNGWGVSTAPATGLASVTCNTVNAGQCVAWTIANNADSQLADLYQESYPKRGGAHLIYVGQFQHLPHLRLRPRDSATRRRSNRAT